MEATLAANFEKYNLSINYSKNSNHVIKITL